MQQIIDEQRASKIALLGSFRWDVLRRKIVLKWCQIYAFGFRFRERQQRKQRKLAAVLRSLYGHTCSQATKDREADQYGFAVVKHSDGLLRMNIHAYARMIYTEKLRASHPWVDSLDREIFLMGFDAGAQFQARTGTESYSQSEGYVSLVTSEEDDNIQKQLATIRAEFLANCAMILPSTPPPPTDRSQPPSQE